MIMPQLTLYFFYLTTHKIPHASLARQTNMTGNGVYDAMALSVLSGTFIMPVY
jgi:hypothetical protein